MARYTPESKDKVRDAADFYALVSERTDLRRVGTQWMGRCPFHDERTASFSVDVEKKVFNCFGCGEKGDVFDFVEKTQGLDFVTEVHAGYLYVDGIVGDVSHGVLRDRRALAEEGVIVVVVTVDAHSGEVLTGPEIITRGWVHAPEAEALLEDARAAVRVSLEEAARAGATDFETLKRRVRSALGRLVNERTRRRPMIVPVVMEV